MASTFNWVLHVFLASHKGRVTWHLLPANEVPALESLDYVKGFVSKLEYMMEGNTAVSYQII